MNDDWNDHDEWHIPQQGRRNDQVVFSEWVVILCFWLALVLTLYAMVSP